jgi:hypothetical protein
MKKSEIIGGILTVSALLFVWYSQSHATQYVSLTAGQTFTLANEQWPVFDIDSTYPVTVKMGQCSEAHIVHEHFNCPAANIVIIDSRPAVLVWAQANRIRLRYRSYK